MVALDISFSSSRIKHRAWLSVLWSQLLQPHSSSIVAVASGPGFYPLVLALSDVAVSSGACLSLWQEPLARHHGAQEPLDRLSPIPAVASRPVRASLHTGDFIPYLWNIYLVSERLGQSVLLASLSGALKSTCLYLSAPRQRGYPGLLWGDSSQPFLPCPALPRPTQPTSATLGYSRGGGGA